MGGGQGDWRGQEEGWKEQEGWKGQQGGCEAARVDVPRLMAHQGHPLGGTKVSLFCTAGQMQPVSRWWGDKEQAWSHRTVGWRQKVPGDSEGRGGSGGDGGAPQESQPC